MNCLVIVSYKNSCIFLWKLFFIFDIINEDCCYLNGLVMVEGKFLYVIFVSILDVIDGWWERRRDGGCVIDIVLNEIIMSGLFMFYFFRFY